MCRAAEAACSPARWPAADRTRGYPPSPSLRHALPECVRQGPELGRPVVEFLLPQLKGEQAPEATSEGGALGQSGQGQLVIDVWPRQRSLGRQRVDDEAVRVTPRPEIERRREAHLVPALVDRRRQDRGERRSQGA